MLKVKFLGGVGTVTGSKTLVSVGSTQVLVDCGLFQGSKVLRERNWSNSVIEPEELDAVVLTHAHIDHSGYIPLLCKKGFRGPIYATQATIDLCRILLPDSGYLHEEEARFANKKGYSRHKPALPLYTHEDALECLGQFVPVKWGASKAISRDGRDFIEVQFHPAGHILGASTVLLKTAETSIAFSGDVGRKSDPMVRDPDFTLGAEHLVVEATYGDRTHPEANAEEELGAAVMETCGQGGILLIPSFAVGRAQLILHYLHQLKLKKKIPQDLPVYLNSPMAAQANRAFAANPDEFKFDLKEIQEIFDGVEIVGSPEDSISLNEKTDPAVIIAASGMATGGRVLHHLKTVLPHPQNTVLFVGFQAGGTRGEALLNGAKEIKIHGEFWPVRAKILSLESLSAHADADEMIEWMSGLKQPPKQVFVTHGEATALEVLKGRIEKELGWPAMVPEMDQDFDIS